MSILISLGSGGQNPTVASPTNSSGSDPDPSALDVLLDEIVSIARECEVFDAHMREFGKVQLVRCLHLSSDRCRLGARL